MRTRRLMVVLPVLVALALVGTAVPAGAGLTDAEQRFCDRYSEGAPPSPDNANSATGQGDYYRDLAKVAPKKSIKKSLKTIAKYFDRLEDVDADDPTAVGDVLSGGLYAKYVKATAKFTTYAINVCSSAAAP